MIGIEPPSSDLFSTTVASVRYRQAVANSSREVGGGIGARRLVVDPGELTQLLERDAGIGSAEIVGVVRQIAGQQHAVVERQAGTNDTKHAKHQRGAVAGQRVVPTRLARQ